jgi:hypothetical protein
MDGTMVVVTDYSKLSRSTNYFSKIQCRLSANHEFCQCKNYIIVLLNGLQTFESKGSIDTLHFFEIYL